VLPFWGTLGPHLTQCRRGRSTRTKWHLEPSSGFATIDMGRKVRAAELPFFWGGAESLSNTMSQGRGLPPYQVGPSGILESEKYAK